MRNKYFYRSRISEKKFRELIRLFSLDMEALKISVLTGLNRNTVNHVLRFLRGRLSDICEREAHFDQGTFECDESYFGARRIRGKRGRGALGKTIVFGIYQRGTKKVCASVVQNVKSQILIDIIERNIPTAAIVYTDGFRSYTPLNQHGYKQHKTVNHGANEFAGKEVHVNGIEGFWSVAKTRLGKFRGLSASSFSLHLKETEYRFNHRHDNLYQLILTNLRNETLN